VGAREPHLTKQGGDSPCSKVIYNPRETMNETCYGGGGEGKKKTKYSLSTKRLRGLRVDPTNSAVLSKNEKHCHDMARICTVKASSINSRDISGKHELTRTL